MHGFPPRQGAFPPIYYGVCKQKTVKILQRYPETKAVNPRCFFSVNSSERKDSFLCQLFERQFYHKFLS